jgi:hypothetical protein
MMPFHRKCAVVSCLLIALFFNLPDTQAQSTDDYQTSENVTFDDAAGWERYDGSIWVAATAAPTSANGQIIIRNGHTASVTANVTLDQVIVESGGIFSLNTQGITFTLNDGDEDDDLKIQSGGLYIHGKSGTGPASMEPPTLNGKIGIKAGGILRVDNAGTGHADWYANNEAINNIQNRMNWETGSIFNWNTTLSFNSSEMTYFPNVTTEVPIFRISGGNLGNIGSNTFTAIKGILELNSGSSILLNSSGIKTIRNGIRGNGTVTQTLTCGAIEITGSTAELSGSGSILLNTGGMKITSSNLDCTETKTIEGTGTVTLERGNSQQIGGTGTLTFGPGVTVDVKNNVSLSGHIVANGTLQLTNGSITLHSYNLTAGTITGYNSSRYVITNSDKNATSGFLIQNATGGKLFPIGTKSGDYTPAFVTGSVPYKVRVFDKVYLNGNGNTEVGEKEEVVQKTWNILPESGNAAAKVQLQWNASNEGIIFQSVRANPATKANLRVAAAPAGGPWANLEAEALGGADPFTLSTLGDANSSDYTFFTAYDNPFVPLPVTLLSFGGRREGTGVRLEWRTASEKDNAGFEVQRSADLRAFVKIGFVEANAGVQNTHSYAFTDENQHRNGYYRLKQLEHNGQFQYSKAIYVAGNTSSTIEGLLLYPNPTAGSVHLSIPDGPIAHLSLRSIQGTIIAQFDAEPNEAESQLNEKLRNLPAGIYFLQTIQGTQVYRNKIIKH